MESPYGTEEEMKKPCREGYFVRDPERDLVYCPGGEILRRKSIKKMGRQDMPTGRRARDAHTVISV